MSRTSFAQLRARLIHLAELAGFLHVIHKAHDNVRARIARFRRSVRMVRLAPLYHLKQLPRQLAYHALHVVALAALVLCMGGTWMVATDANATPGQTAAVTSPSSSPASTSTTAGGVNPITDDDLPRMRPAKKEVTGKLNINTATEAELMLLPSVGPSKAERVVAWRKKNGTFKRPADLRRVKGFGYKTFKRLEPFLDIKGDTTLAPRR